MISRTFKSAAGRTLTIEPSDGRNILFATAGSFMALKIEEAPAIALATFEAAEVPMQGNFDRHRPGTSEHLSFIAQHLERYVAESEHIAAEARERAELEAEALELLNVHRKAERFDYSAEWDDLSNETKNKWIAVARRAREIAKEATK